MYKAVLYVLCLFLFIDSFKSLSANTEVKVITTEHVPYTQTIGLSGTVVAKNNAELAPLESGVVKELFVEAGDSVTLGQSLLTLDDILAKLRLEQARANHQAAKVQLNEAKRLFDEVQSLAKSKAVADSLIAERRANMASAKADLTSALASLRLQEEVVKRHTLIAPFEGVISSRNVDVGEWINQQDKIFQLVSNKSLRLIANLPQEHFAKISEFTDIEVSVIPDALQDKQFQLKLTNIISISDPQSRTVQVRIDIPDDSSLIPGMSAKAIFSLSGANNVVTWLPRSALKRHPDGGFSAFSVDSGRLKHQQIQIVMSNLDHVAVAGIPNNTDVVISGAELLKHDQAVIITSRESISMEGIE